MIDVEIMAALSRIEAKLDYLLDGFTQDEAEGPEITLDGEYAGKDREADEEM